MKNILNKHLNLVTGLFIITLVLFGFYKNGIFLYSKNYISTIEMFKPLLIVFMSISGGIVGSFIREWKKNKKLNLEYIDNLKAIIIENAIVACTLPISTSPLIVFLLVMLVNIFVKRSKLNHIAISFIVISVIDRLIGEYSFLNIYEASTTLNYNRLDLFLGLGSGGIASTSNILILFALLVLCFNKLYKRDIALFSILTFVIITLGITIISNNYSGFFKTIFAPNILFSLVFIAPITNPSCYTNKGQILSGIIIGIMTIVLSIFVPYESVFIAILFVSLIKNIIDRIFVLI